MTDQQPQTIQVVERHPSLADVYLWNSNALRSGVQVKPRPLQETIDQGLNIPGPPFKMHENRIAREQAEEMALIDLRRAWDGVAQDLALWAHEIKLPQNLVGCLMEYRNQTGDQSKLDGVELDISSVTLRTFHDPREPKAKFEFSKNGRILTMVCDAPQKNAAMPNIVAPFFGTQPEMRELLAPVAQFLARPEAAYMLPAILAHQAHSRR